MQVLDVALEKEVEAERYYRELAAKAPESGMAAILNRLADTEQRHQYVIKCMQEDRLDADASDDTFLATVKAQCEALAKSTADFAFERSQIDLYTHARDREADSRKLYLNAAEAAEDPGVQALFEQLAAQEAMHYQILDSIIDFVSRPEPGHWLEDAEWYHRETY